ncbi:MAG: hypothetical protein V4850_30575 [Myxococcota bacterium]
MCYFQGEVRLAANEFDSEREMVDRMLGLVISGASPWSPSRMCTEFEYANGRTDVIALLDSHIVLALEAKLTRWRIAVDQAYRNTCFAHRSFVVLPWKEALRASAHRAEFERRRIGLCGVRSDRIVVLIEPSEVHPVLPHLTTKAIARLDQEFAA